MVLVDIEFPKDCESCKINRRTPNMAICPLSGLSKVFEKGMRSINCPILFYIDEFENGFEPIENKQSGEIVQFRKKDE